MALLCGLRKASLIYFLRLSLSWYENRLGERSTTGDNVDCCTASELSQALVRPASFEPSLQQSTRRAKRAWGRLSHKLG